MFNEKIPFIFISYSHRDSDRVCPIIERLKKEGFNVWYDDGIEPGSEWDENIATHISQCGYFVAFISENYLGSHNCKDELNFARDLDKERLLIYLEEVALSGGMAMRMNRNQAIYWNKCENIEKAYQKLFSAVGIEKTRVFTPKPAEQPVQQPMPAPQPVQPRPVQQPTPVQPRPVQQPTPVQPRPAQQPTPVQPRPAQQPMPVQQPVARPMQQSMPVQQQPVQPRPAQQPMSVQQSVARPVQQPTPMQQPMPKPVQPQQPVQLKNTKKQSNGLKIGLIIAGSVLALLLVVFVSFMVLVVIGSGSSSNNEVVIEEDATVNDLLPLAEDGHVDAMYRLGELYYYGYNGVEVDYNKGLYWIAKAADNGNYDALKFMMFIYGMEDSPVEIDYVKCIELAHKVLEQNPEDLDALFIIGYCYNVGGYGVEIDYEEAVVWYTKAAELGDADSMYNLALCYYYGYGVEVDQEMGDMWMQAYEEAVGN